MNKNKINIYSLSLNSRILIELLKEKKIKIDKIIDSNQLFQGKIYKNIKIVNKLGKNEINKRLFFVPLEFKKYLFGQKIFIRKKEKLIFFKFHKFSDLILK